MNAPKYSILLPTRNGIKYLPFAVNSVLSQQYENFELIVSVNHSKDNSLQFLQAIKDERLKVIVPPSELSMTKHFEYILSNASGEWITILGDDDGLMPFFFREVENIIQENPTIEAISSRRAYFYWDNANEAYGTDSIVDFSISKRTSYKRSFGQIIATLAGIQPYFELPQLYTAGLVNKKSIERIKNRCGNQFYFSIIPDAYSAAAILSEVSGYLRTEIPLCWVGSSPKSAGFSYATVTNPKNKELGELSTALKMQNGIVNDFFELMSKDNLNLNQGISEKMLLANLGTNLFFYESLISCPFTRKRWKSKFIEYIVYSGVLVNLLTTRLERPIEAKEKTQLFFEEFRKLDLRLFYLYLSIIIVFIYNGISKSATFANLAFFKILSFFFSRYKKTKFISKDPDLFPDMAAASQKALEIYDATFNLPSHTTT